MMLKAENTRSKGKWPKIPIVGVAAALLMAGCANLNPVSPEDAVRERAKQRWMALVSGDIRKAYELTTPSFRSISSYENYQAKFGRSVNLLAAEVVSVTCQKEQCTAVVRVDAHPLLGARFGNTISTHVDETWLLEDGHWWFFQKL